MQKIKDKLPYLLSLFAAAFVVIWAYGCESKTQSLLVPAKQITRPELVNEIDYLMQKYEIAISELDKKDEFRNTILQQSIIIAQTGTLNPLGIATSILAILGVGAGADNVRLRKQRKNVDKNIATRKPD